MVSEDSLKLYLCRSVRVWCSLCLVVYESLAIRSGILNI
jgi:hypothetical protein